MRFKTIKWIPTYSLDIKSCNIFITLFKSSEESKSIKLSDMYSFKTTVEVFSYSSFIISTPHFAHQVYTIEQQFQTKKYSPKNQ